MKTLEVQTAEEWRKWLADHHDSESDLWLIFYKRHTGRSSIAYEDAVDEALCFGWIDSLIKRIDEARYARKFTPRLPHSNWSDANRARYARLRANGRLAPAGVNRAPTDRSQDRPRPRLAMVPHYIEDGLKSSPTAWSYFERLAPSHRREYIGWIDSAKQTETKLRRLREATRMLAAGKKVGLK